MADFKQNNYSHCKINGTERSILTALAQTLKLVGHNNNPVTTGKVPNFLFAACRINKFNLNIVDFIATMSKLKTTEMMYGIQIKVAVATVFEMQRQLGCPDLNEKYMHVKSTHPNDSDDVALRCYHYLWATTSSFELGTQAGNEAGKDVGSEVVGSEVVGSVGSEVKTPVHANTPNNTPLGTTPSSPTSLIPTSPLSNTSGTSNDSSHDDSEDILPRRNFKETGSSLGKKQMFTLKQ